MSAGLSAEEPKPQVTEITVICTDDVRIQVDLNLFPSPMLRVPTGLA